MQWRSLCELNRQPLYQISSAVVVQSVKLKLVYFIHWHQVKVSLDGLMEALLELSDTGDCVARVDHLLGDLKTLEDKAQVKIF